MLPTSFTRSKSQVQSLQRPPEIIQDFKRARKRKATAGQVGGQVGPAYSGLADVLISFSLTAILVFGAVTFGWITVRP